MWNYYPMNGRSCHYVETSQMTDWFLNQFSDSELINQFVINQFMIAVLGFNELRKTKTKHYINIKYITEIFFSPISETLKTFI